MEPEGFPASIYFDPGEYELELEEEVARFALYLVPGEVETQGEITL